MEFKDIISITGMPGLYEMVSSKGDGIIVKSLVDGKSQFIASRMQGVSSLDTISIFLKHEEAIELKKVFIEMGKKESEIPLPDGKDEKLLKSYMERIVPNYDPGQVHVSDMKKLVRWYSLLKEKNLLPVEEVKKEEEITK